MPENEHDHAKRVVNGRVGGKRVRAKTMADYPLDLEQAARYIEVPISVLRAGMRGELMYGVEPPKLWQRSGRMMFFLAADLDDFILRRAGVL
jgi:hypothetical protein